MSIALLACKHTRVSTNAAYNVSSVLKSNKGINSWPTLLSNTKYFSSGGDGDGDGEGAFDRFLRRRGGKKTQDKKETPKESSEEMYYRPSQDHKRTIRVPGMGSDHYKPQKGIRKQNVAKKLFEPAFEGKLSHKEEIPRLMGRKGKSHAVHDATPGVAMRDNVEDMLEEEDEFGFPYNAFEDYGKETRHFATTTSTEAKKSLVSMKTMRDDKSSEGKKYPTIIKNGKKYTYNPNHFPKDLFSFDFDTNDDVPTYTLEDELNADEILPLPAHGNTVDDFVAADMSNPAKYSYVYQPFIHIESRREPKPIHRERLNPPKNFLKGHEAFLFIFDLHLPPRSIAHTMKDLKHHYAKVLDVGVEHLFMCSKTSLFLGLDTKDAAERNLKRLHRMSVSNPITISMYQQNEKEVEDNSETNDTEELEIDDKKQEGEDDKKNTGDRLEQFLASTPDTKSILQISGIKINSGTNPQEIIDLYFPPNTYHSKLYENITVDDLYLRPFTSTIFLRLSTPKHAFALATSQSFTARMTKLNESLLQVYPASREKVFKTFQGPNFDDPVYVKGDKLVVLGDIPLKPEFYTSHEAVVWIDNLPLDITKQKLTLLLQPYCEMMRDVEGSIQFVTCPYGHATGRAFIGFDLPGEAETFMSASFSIQDKPINKKLLRDKQLYKKIARYKNGRRILIKGKRLPPRPNRSEEEILDSLHNWEQHCNPKKLQDVIDYGIDKDHLDSIFVSARYKNRSFGAWDLARSCERLEVDRPIGSRYKNFVNLYINTLWECLPWKEAPGDAIRAMFMEGQKLDYEGMGFKLFESKVGSVGPRRVQLARKRRLERESAKSDT